MAYVIDLDAVPLVIILLEGQDDQHPLDVAFDSVNAIRAPGPNLRADIVDHPVTVALEPSGKPQVEFGPVDQDDEPRPALIGRVAQAAEDAQEFRQRPGDFERAHNRHFPRVHEGLDPGLPHLVAARAEKFEPDKGAKRSQRRDQLRAVFIARSLAGDDHQGEWGVGSGEWGVGNVWRRLTWLFLFLSRRHRNSLASISPLPTPHSPLPNKFQARPQAACASGDESTATGRGGGG